MRPHGLTQQRWKSEVSIHAPLARCDDILGSIASSTIGFQFTHLLRGATFALYEIAIFETEFQFTHLLRGATLFRFLFQYRSPVSIHAPLARCDCRSHFGKANCTPFQFTHLLRGATINIFSAKDKLGGFNSRTSCEVRLKDPPISVGNDGVSIHAPLARCDFYNFSILTDNNRVSIHAPLARCDVFTISVYGRI